MSKRSRDMAVRHLNSGVSFIEKGLYADAILTLEQAETDAREAESPEILAGVLQTYADLLLSEGREEEAIEKYTEAEKIIIKLSGKGYAVTEQLAGIYSNVAPVLEKRGERAEARDKYEASVSNYENLLVNDRNNVTYRSNAVSTLNNLGALLAEDREYEAAKNSFQKALDIMERSPDDVKESVTFQFRIATVLGNLLDLENDSGQIEGTEEKYGQLVETYRKTVRMDPLEESYKERLSIALVTYGDRMAVAGNKDESRDMYKEALDILEKLSDEKEDERQYGLIKADILKKLASYFAEKKYHESAKNNLIKALELLEKLLAQDPSNPENRARTVAILADLNDLVENEEASEAKLACYGLIERLAVKLLNINPTSLPYRLNVAFSQNIKGSILADLNRKDEAASELTKAIDNAMEILQIDTDDTYLHAASSLIDDMGLFADRMKNREERLRIYGIVLNRLEELADIYPEETSIKADIADLLEKISKTMVEKKNFHEVEFILGEAAAIYDHLLSIEPGNDNYSTKLSSVLMSMGEVYSEMKNQEKALETYLRLFRMATEDKEHGGKLDAILTELETEPLHADNKDTMLAEYEKLLAIRKELQEAEPDNAQYQRNLAGLRERIAYLLLEMGRSDEGLDILCSQLSSQSQSPYNRKVIDTLEKFRLSIPKKSDTEEMIKDYGLLLETYGKLIVMGLADVHIREERAEVLEKLALLNDENGSIENAKSNYEYALSAYAELRSSAPSEMPALIKTGNLKCRLASLLTDMGNMKDAEQMFRSAFDDYQELLEYEPSNISYQENAAYILNNLGYLLLEEGLFREAKPLYENALKMYVHILDADPENMACKTNAACTLNNLGYILENIGRENDALWMYEKARELSNDLS